MQLILANLLLGSVVLELLAWPLSASTCFEWSLFEEELFKVVRGVEVGLLARRYEDGLDFLPLQEFEIDGLEERILTEAFEANRSNALLDVAFKQGANGVQTCHRYWGLGHGEARIRFDDLRGQLFMPMPRKGSLYNVRRGSSIPSRAMHKGAKAGMTDLVTYFVVDALEKGNAERPPIYLTPVTLLLVDFWCEICQRARSTI